MRRWHVFGSVASGTERQYIIFSTVREGSVVDVLIDNVRSPKENIASAIY